MIWPKKKNVVYRLAVVILSGSVLVALLVWRSRPPLPERLRLSCLQIMGRGDCAIMHSTGLLPDDVQQIFISGFGALSATTYRSLQRSGIYMCDTIREACKDDEQSEICRYGKAVY